MTIEEINKNYDVLASEIYQALENIIDPNDISIIYELSQEDIDNGDYEYWVDCYGKNGEIYELSIERVNKNGEIYGYVSQLGTYWTIYTSDIHNLRDKLTIINIINDAKRV